MNNKHPIQPLYLDDSGVKRFKANKIVEFLLDNGPYDMNDLARMDFDNKEREHFAQLIGYSLNGFADLSYTSYDTYSIADNMLDNKLFDIDDLK